MNQLIKSIWRFPLKKKMRSKLIINNVRIVSSNCIGGILYNELGLEFLSPTINLTIEPFGKFCSKLDYYLNYKTNDWVMSYDFKEGYPVAKIDEITI